jgi:hypothetical protein
LITRGHEHYGDLPYPKTGAPAQLVVPPAVDFSWTPSGKGYTIIDAGGYTWDFGDAVHQEPYKK